MPRTAGWTALSALRSGSPIKSRAHLYSVRSNSWLAWSNAELGNFDDGLACGEEGIRIAEAVDQPFSLITAYVGVAIVCLRKGDLVKATTLLERGLALARARDLPVLFPTVASRLGSAYVLLGRLDEAFPLLEGASAEAATMNRLSGHALRLTQLGEAYLAAGRIADALTIGEQALELSLKHQEDGYRAWALRLLAEGRAAQKQDLAAARAYFGQSIRLAASLGMRPLVAHCHIGLSRLCRQAGELERVREHVATGTGLYRSMGMRFWMERAEAESERVS